MSSGPSSSRRTAADTSRGVESLLWLAAGAAWALVALKAWSQSKKVERRRRTFAISDRLLRQVFPNGMRLDRHQPRDDANQRPAPDL